MVAYCREHVTGTVETLAVIWSCQAQQHQTSEQASQDEMTGIARRALGYQSSDNEEMNELGAKNRAVNDEFKPWENAILESGVYDRRSTFEKAFERGRTRLRHR